jgi:CRP-like cAMP-binding protein
VGRADDRAMSHVPEGHFVAERGPLTRQRPFLATHATAESRVVALTAETLRRLVSETPELGEAVVAAC